MKFMRDFKRKADAIFGHHMRRDGMEKLLMEGMIEC